MFDLILKGKLLKCLGLESFISECLKDFQCDQYDIYVLVMCFIFEDFRNEIMMLGSKDFSFFYILVKYNILLVFQFLLEYKELMM